MAQFNGGFRGGGPKPPEKGSFPLDHFAECTPLFRSYIQCLKQNESDNRACKEASKLYVVCRMEKGLMEVDELSRIGFDEQSMKQLTVSTRCGAYNGNRLKVYTAHSLCFWH